MVVAPFSIFFGAALSLLGRESSGRFRDPGPRLKNLRDALCDSFASGGRTQLPN